MNVIRTYLHQGLIYYHVMDTDTDRILLKSFEGNYLLMFDSNCKVYDISALSTETALGVVKKLVPHNMPIAGLFSLNEQQYWVYTSEGQEIVSSHHLNEVEGLLDFEVEVAKLWLDKHTVDTLHPKTPTYFTKEQIEALKDDPVKDTYLIAARNQRFKAEN